MTVTLGVEEELQVVDDHTYDLSAHDHARSSSEKISELGVLDREIHRCAVELKTPICTSPDAIEAALLGLRQLAAQRASAQAQCVLAAGLHPTADWRSQPMHEDAVQFPHYANLINEYQDVARSAMSFGFHVHLGLPDPRMRMPVMNRLRDVLPLIFALSANSPFFESRDTGLHSWRHSVLDRYPRMGIPEVWESEEAYVAHVVRLRQMGSLDPAASLWEDLRLHHRYGTLEVRICDAHHRLERIWLIVALLQAETLTLIHDLEAGTLRPIISRAYLEENKWRARRHGLDATIVDWHEEKEVLLSTCLEVWLKRVSPAARELGFGERLKREMTRALAVGTGAGEQRAWLKRAGNWRDVVGELIHATSERHVEALSA